MQIEIMYNQNTKIQWHKDINKVRQIKFMLFDLHKNLIFNTVLKFPAMQVCMNQTSVATCRK